jgi:hypothetical protein
MRSHWNPKPAALGLAALLIVGLPAVTHAVEQVKPASSLSKKTPAIAVNWPLRTTAVEPSKVGLRAPEVIRAQQPAEGLTVKIVPTAAPLTTAPISTDWCGGKADTTWFAAEYLYWFQKGGAVPPLVTTSPAGTARDDAGVLGTPGATVVFGDDRLGTEGRSGFRLSGGRWFDCQQCLGVQASFFLLETRGDNFTAASDESGSPILARPFNDASPFPPLLGGPASELVSFPGIFSGTVEVRSSSTVWGADAHLRHCLLSPCCGMPVCGPSCAPSTTRLDVIGGLRYLRLRESLGIREDILSIDPNSEVIVPGTRFEVYDYLQTESEFYGLDLGIMGEQSWGMFSLAATARLAFGVSRNQVDIHGVSRTTVPGGDPVVSAGGLLAQPTNSGSYDASNFTIVPQLDLKLYCNLRPNIRASLGYTFLYWDHVARPGDQIDLQVNSTQIGGFPRVGLALPEFELRDSSYWLQGVSAGLEIKF